MRNTKKILKTLLKIVVSIGFFSILLSFIEQNELAALFTQIDWFYFGVSFVITAVMLLASCMKWQVVLELKEKGLSFFYLLKVYFIGYFFSNLLPSTVGGDVIRSFYVGEKTKNHAYSAVAIFIERFTGILFLFFLAMVAPLFHRSLYSSPYVYIPAIAGFCLLCITFWIWKAKNPLKVAGLIKDLIFKFLRFVCTVPGLKWSESGVNWLEKVWQNIEGKLVKLREELQEAIEIIAGSKKTVIKIFLLTILFYGLTWLNVYFSFRAFGVKPDFLLICALTPTIMFAAHLPVTLLGNIGYFESVFVFFFLLVGIPAEQTLAMSLLLRVKTLFMGVVGLVVYLLYRAEYGKINKQQKPE